VALTADLNGTKFNWCAYATDYPPNATDGAGAYVLHGSPPFVVNGDTLGDGVRTYAGCITALTDATGCPGLLPATGPAVGTLAATPSPVCESDTLTLEASATDAALYSFDNGASWQTSHIYKVSPVTATTYNVLVKNSSGCTATLAAATTVTISPAPVITAFTAIENCLGASATLEVTATGASEYSIDGGASWTSSTAIATPPLNTTTTFTVLARSDAGCTATYASGVVVTILPQPTPTLQSSAATACAGRTITFTAGGGAEYCFTQSCLVCVRNPYLSGNDENGAGDCETLNTTSCSYSTSNTYSVTMPESGSITVWVRVRTGAGCVDSISRTVSVTPTNIVTLLSSPTTLRQTVDRGAAIDPIIAATSAGTACPTVTGSLPTGLANNCASNNKRTFSGTPTTAGAYTYTLTAGGACSSTLSGTLTVEPTEVVTFTSASTSVRFAASFTNNADRFLYIDWGDGSAGTALAYTGILTYNHTYTDDTSSHTVTVKTVRLSYFSITDQQATAVTVSGCTSLGTLLLYNNQLTSFTVSGCTALTTLQLHNNRLTSFAMSGCTALSELKLQNNRFSYLELNNLFGILPMGAYRTVYIYGNPGTSACDTSLAAARGWTVNKTTAP
jgi:hypothetical protein